MSAVSLGPEVGKGQSGRLPRWALVALALPVWISIPLVSVLTRDLGVTLGAGESGALNASVLRLLLSAAMAIPVALIAGRRTRWTALAVTAAAWAITSIASAAIVPESAGFTMAWSLAGVADVSGFVAIGLLVGVAHEQGGRASTFRLVVALWFASVAFGSLVSGIGGPWLALNWRGILVAMIGLVVPGAFAAATMRFDVDPRVLERARRTPSLTLGELCGATVANTGRRRGLLSVGLSGSVVFTWLSFGPSLLRLRWGFSTTGAALVVAATMAAAATLAGAVARPCGLGRSGAVIGPVLFVGALALPGPKPAFVALLIGAFAVIGLGLACAFTDVAAAADEETRPMATALGYLAFAVGGAVGVLLASTVDRRFGTAVGLVVCSVPALLAALVNIAVPVPADGESPLVRPVDEHDPLVHGDGDRPLLELKDIDVFYGSIQVLFGVNLTIHHGEIVALLGTNGAGKSTVLKVIAGQILPRSGTVLLEGTNITSLSAERRVPLGLSQIPGGRAVFGSLTVVENLELFAASLGKDRAAVKRGIERTFATFPRLEAHRNRHAETLSGGEQQMLALGKALLLEPRLLCIDELSLGLAPAVVADLLDLVRTIHANGTTIVIVEQSVNIALSVAQRAIFMEKGEVRFDGDASELRDRSDLLRSVFLHGAAN